MTLFLNGTQVDSYTNSNIPTTFPNLVLGLGFANIPDRDFNGQMDEFRIWNYAKTQEQVKGQKDIELSGKEIGLLAYYDFNQGIADANNATVTTLLPQAGNKNGNLQGFVLNGTTSNWTTSTPMIKGGVLVEYPNMPQLFLSGREGQRTSDEIEAGKEIKIEVIFVDFPDRKASPADLDAYWSEITAGNKLFEAFKAQGATVTAHVNSGWREMPGNITDYFPPTTEAQNWDAYKYIADAIKLLGEDVDFSPNTICVVVPNKNETGFKQVGSGAHTQSYRGIRRIITLMPPVYAKDGYQVLMHEIGHTFGSGELYPANLPYLHEVAGYDVMASAGNATGFMGWHRYRYGWLGQERIQFLPQEGDYQVPLKKLSAANGKAMVVIPDPDKLFKYWVIEIGQKIVSAPPKDGTEIYNNEGDRIIVYTVEHPEVTGKRAIRLVPRESFHGDHNTQEWVDKASYKIGVASDRTDMPFTFSSSNKSADGCMLNVHIKKDIEFLTFPENHLSDNKQFKLVFQPDGNLVIPEKGWDAKTKLFPGLPTANTWVALRNGNIQLVDALTGKALGEKMVSAPAGSLFKVGNDGALLIVDSSGKEMWRNN